MSQISYPEDVLLYLDLEECLGLCQGKKRYRPFMQRGHMFKIHTYKDLECLRMDNFDVIGTVYVCG